jgi:hypothetical protein
VEGSGCGLFKAAFQHLSEGTVDIKKTSVGTAGLCTAASSKSATHCTVPFDMKPVVDIVELHSIDASYMSISVP